MRNSVSHARISCARGFSYKRRTSSLPSGSGEVRLCTYRALKLAERREELWDFLVLSKEYDIITGGYDSFIGRLPEDKIK